MAEIVLTGKQAAFVAAFVENELTGGNLTGRDLAIKAGVAERSAHPYASNALRNPTVLAAIAERKRVHAEAQAGLDGVDAKWVVREWTQIAVADPTDVVTVRRVNCRHCHGFRFGYQYTDHEYATETAQAMQAEEDLSRFAGGPGFRYNRPPNPECPECSGEGVEDVHIADLRKLKGPARRLIAGVKMGKYGPEVQFRDQNEAVAKLASYLGLLVNRNEHTGPGGGPIQTQNVNYSLPSDPVEAARAYQLLMEGKV